MNAEEIKKYASLMKDLGLTGMEVKSDDVSIRLEMNPSPPVIVPQNAAVPAAAPAPAAEEKKSEDDSKFVNAKFVGVFYSSPSESEAAYVKVGDRVKKGQVVCIIEAMKLINEIVMEEDGVITEICAKHGQLVEYGTHLFKYRAA